MKRHLVITLFLALSTLAWMSFSISAAEDGAPSKVAKKFLKAYEKGDWDQAKEYCTTETANSLDVIKSMGHEAQNRKVKILSEGISNDTEATVIYTLDGEDKERELKLIKDGGEWKVATSKMELPGMGLDESSAGLDEPATPSPEEETTRKVTPGKASKIAESFIAAMEAGNYEEAKKYTTESSSKQIDMMRDLENEPQNRTFVLDEEYQNAAGTIARVMYHFREDEPKGEEIQMKVILFKEGRKWLVSASKLDLNGTSGLEKSLEEALEELGSSMDSLIEEEPMKSDSL